MSTILGGEVRQTMLWSPRRRMCLGNIPFAVGAQVAAVAEPILRLCKSYYIHICAKIYLVCWKGVSGTGLSSVRIRPERQREQGQGEELTSTLCKRQEYSWWSLPISILTSRGASTKLICLSMTSWSLFGGCALPPVSYGVFV